MFNKGNNDVFPNKNGNFIGNVAKTAWGPVLLPETNLINTFIKDFCFVCLTGFVIFLCIAVILASNSSSPPKEIAHVLMKAVNNIFMEITAFLRLLLMQL